MIAIKDMVENPHPIYLRYKPYWDFLLQSYEGGIDYAGSVVQQSNQGLFDSIFRVFINGQQQTTQTLTGNLFMHPKERVADYSKRLQMSYYYNFCAPIIDIYSNHLFKVPVIEEFEDLQTTVDSVGEDIDKSGSSISEFRKEIADIAQIFGHVFVLVDSPSIPESEVLTKQDQIDNRAFPYLTIIYPQNLINWALDENGKPYWVLIRECFEGNKDPATFDKNRKDLVVYKLWTRFGWEMYDNEYNLMAGSAHPVGEVPIVCVFDKKSRKVKSFLGVSSLADIAFIARDIYNSCSELRQILRDQTFAFLAINGSSDEYSELEIGTGKGLLYPEGRNKPEYVSPPSDNAQVYFDHIDRQVTKIFELAKLEGGGTGGRVKAQPQVDQQSGVSKAWDFNQTNSALNEKAGNLEDGEYKIWRFVSLWQGQEFTGKIKYPNEFSVTSLKDDLDELEQEMRCMMGKTFNVEVRKTIIKKKFPNKDKNDIEEMVKEVEEEQDVNDEAKQLTNRYSSMFNKNAGGNGGKSPFGR